MGHSRPLNRRAAQYYLPLDKITLAAVLKITCREVGLKTRKGAKMKPVRNLLQESKQEMVVA